MNDKTITMERADTAEEMAAAFARPAGELVPIGHHPAPMPSGQGLTVHDGIITAQKVDVERDLGKVMKNIKILAAAAGDDWYYRFPVKKKGGGVDHIEGPSIKCANNVARIYGNCQIDSRVLDNGDSWIIYARFVDYETGFSMTRPFQQRKGQTSVKSSDAGRQLDIALQIGVSKAIRNVVSNALETFVTFAFEEARNNLVEKVGKKLPEYRARIVERLGQMGIDIKRVETALGRSHGDWLAADVARVIAEIKAIADGMATADETWPADAPVEPQRKDFQQQGGDDAGAAGGASATSTTDNAGVISAKPASDATEAKVDSKAAAPAKATAPAAAEAADTPTRSWDLFDHTGTQVGAFDAAAWLVEFNKCAKVAGKKDAESLDKANIEAAKAIAAHGGTSQQIKDDLGRRFGPALW
jgi:hypothetical protein